MLSETDPHSIPDVLEPGLLNVKEPLGRGGFAIVYAATYGSDKKPVALKVLQPSKWSKASAADYERMFLREAACAKHHTHNHLVKCYGVVAVKEGFPGINGISGSTWGIVLELCETYTTKNLIVQCMSGGRSVYTNLLAYQWLTQVASALSYLHGQRPPVIHRDIKQENVLLSKDTSMPGRGPYGHSAGGGCGRKSRLVAKLADLGLHVTVEEDRSVLLRRKDTGLSTRSIHSMHSRPQTITGCSASGVTAAVAPLDGAVARKVLAAACTDQKTPFYAVGANFGGSAGDNGSCRSSLSAVVPLVPSGLADPPCAPSAPVKVLPSPSVPGSNGTVGYEPQLEVVSLRTQPAPVAAVKALVDPVAVRGADGVTGPSELSADSCSRTVDGDGSHHLATSAPTTLSYMPCARPASRCSRLTRESACGPENGEAGAGGGATGPGGSRHRLSQQSSVEPHRRSSTAMGALAGSGSAARPRTSSAVAMTMATSMASTAVTTGMSGLSDATSPTPRLSRHVHTLVLPPDLMQPVGPTASLTSGTRRVGSLLTLLQQTELSSLRQPSADWVFGLTGKAGSCMYMAPEVYCKLPYNEKADVYSFGVLMYELLSRELLIIAYFNTPKGAKLGMKTPEDYAAKVCEGFRPPRPACLSDAVWSLIEACWHDDPVQRPRMEEVLVRLEELRDLEEAHPTDPKQFLGCGPGGCTVQ